MSLSQRDEAVIWHPFTQMKTAGTAIPIVKGEGAYLIAEDGKRYLDAISSWWVNLHGHSHPYIAERLAKQALQLEHVMFAGFTHPPAVELAERLLGHLPSNLGKIFYSDNGSTAVEVALKMAFQYWHNLQQPKYKVIALEGSYHGDTFGAMSVSTRDEYTHPFVPNLFEVLYIPTPIEGKEEASLQQLSEYLQADDIAAVIFEPLVQGADGMTMYPARSLDKLISMCRDKGLLVIADEVMTGFGRTGKIFASDHLLHKPDIICLSKGLTGGAMALGVTACIDTIYETFYSEDSLKTFFHGHSFTANPLACTAALASLDLLERQETQASILRINARHEAYKEKVEQHPKLKNVRVLGTILAFELRTDERDTYFNSIRDYLYQFFIERGILLRPLGNTLYVLPPYCITDADLAKVYSAIDELLRSFD